MLGFFAHFLTGNHRGIFNHIVFGPFTLKGFNRGRGADNDVGLLDNLFEALADIRKRWYVFDDLANELINTNTPLVGLAQLVLSLSGCSLCNLMQTVIAEQ